MKVTQLKDIKFYWCTRQTTNGKEFKHALVPVLAGNRLKFLAAVKTSDLAFGLLEKRIVTDKFKDYYVCAYSYKEDNLNTKKFVELYPVISVNGIEYKTKYIKDDYDNIRIGVDVI